MVDETIKQINTLIIEVVEFQKDYVSKVCPLCLHPCCMRVAYLYSDKDILFLKLSGKKQPRKRQLPGRKGCGFLGPSGCILDFLSRPFICHKYICTDLETAINREEPELLKILEDKFILIDEMRSRLWSEYLDNTMAAGSEGDA